MPLKITSSNHLPNIIIIIIIVVVIISMVKSN